MVVQAGWSLPCPPPIPAAGSGLWFGAPSPTPCMGGGVLPPPRACRVLWDPRTTSWWGAPTATAPGVAPACDAAGGAGLGRVPNCLGGLSRGCHTHATVPPVPQFPLCSQSPKGGRRARPSPGRVAPWTGHRVPSQTGRSLCPQAGWTPCPSRAGLLSRLRPSSPVAATGLAHIPALCGSPVSPATRPERGPSPRLTPGMSHVQHACAMRV